MLRLGSEEWDDPDLCLRQADRGRPLEPTAIRGVRTGLEVCAQAGGRLSLAGLR